MVAGREPSSDSLSPASTSGVASPRTKKSPSSPATHKINNASAPLQTIYSSIDHGINAWRGRLDHLLRLFVLSLWVGGFVYAGTSFLIALFFLPHPLATFWVGLCFALISIPITDAPAWARAFIQFSISSSVRWNNTRVLYEDPEAFAEGAGPFIFGVEPHGVMPVALAEAFNAFSGLMPPAVSKSGVHALASSTCFYAPFVRHLWWWLGIRPVGRESVRHLLSHGASVALNPGGVVECLRMQHDEEILYLKTRRGFVRMAQQTGAKIVPVFVFGHSRVYSWRRYDHPWLERFSRFAGFAPMAFWGYGGTPVPHRVPLTVIMGRPIEVPQNAEGREDSGDSSTSHLVQPQPQPQPQKGAKESTPPPGGAGEENLVDRALHEFIAEMRRIYNKHREAYGDPANDLIIL